MLPARGTLSKARRGFGVIEFTMAAIPIIFMTTSIIEMSLESWKFHSMAYAIQVADRYACQHGHTCSQNGNTCTIEVETVAAMISQQAPSLDPSLLDVTMTANGATTTCNPLNSCFSTATQFPGSTNNQVGFPITISVTYPMHNPLPMLWFGSKGSSGSVFTLGATTTQLIVY